MDEPAPPATKREAIEELRAFNGTELLYAEAAKRITTPFDADLQERIDELKRSPERFRATFAPDVTDEDRFIAIQDLTGALVRHAGGESSTASYGGTGFTARAQTEENLDWLAEVYEVPTDGDASDRDIPPADEQPPRDSSNP